jgi:hypothetical protein
MATLSSFDVTAAEDLSELVWKWKPGLVKATCGGRLQAAYLVSMAWRLLAEQRRWLPADIAGEIEGRLDELNRRLCQLADWRHCPKNGQFAAYVYV